MALNFLQILPTPDETRKLYPVPPKVAEIKKKRDEEIRKVFTGESGKFLVMIGPCSADNEEAVCDYVRRLVPIQEEIRDKVILIPRIYTNKPRTTGEGYKGILHQPDPEKKPDPLAGIIALRRMHIRAVEESGLTAADEMLYPENVPYVDDFLSYIAVGARSVENQQHRLTASGMNQVYRLTGRRQLAVGRAVKFRRVQIFFKRLFSLRHITMLLQIRRKMRPADVGPRGDFQYFIPIDGNADSV